VGNISRYAQCAIGEQSFSRITQGAAGIDNIIDQYAVFAAHITDHIHNFRFTGFVATLINDGQWRIHTARQSTGAYNTAHQALQKDCRLEYQRNPESALHEDQV